MDNSSQQALENRIYGIYRTFYENFGSVPVPHGAELDTLWNAWEQIEAEGER